MDNDGVNLINDYFDDVLYDLEHKNTIDAIMEDAHKIIGNRIVDVSIQSREDKNNIHLISKMENFKRSYIELAEAMYGVDYDFTDGYPLDNSFYDIDFIGWEETTKLNLSQQSGDRQKDMESYNKSILKELKQGKYSALLGKTIIPHQY